MNTVTDLNRITFHPNIIGGKPCIRGMRVTVGTIVGLIAAGHSIKKIVNAYPYLEFEDIQQALAYEKTLDSYRSHECPSLLDFKVL